jgi:YgiT-type zinc finger domain-containing protein
MNTDFDAKWDELAEEVMSGMKEWRLQHPRATLSEIERALDERLAKMRARMLQDAALASSVANIQSAAESERPRCPECGAVLEGRGRGVRQLTTHHEQSLVLERSYGVCPQCGAGFFPPG